MLDLNSPSIVVVSDFTTPETIIKQILKCDVLPESLCLGEDIEGYLWEIDTKYYKACVNICPVKIDDTIPEKLWNSTEGIVIYFDGQNPESFKRVKKWSDSIKEIPEVFLLVCDNIIELSKEDRLWCGENTLELIELNEELEQVNDDDVANSMFPDKFGVDRIIEALEAHTWSNLEMKSKTNTTYTPGLEAEGDHEDFGELFCSLQSMRESIQSLAPRERKACAEQVVATFWKAIGGDEDELDDIIPPDI